MPSETDVAADLVICADLQLGNCCCRLLLLLALAVLAQSPAAAARDALFSFALKQSWTKRPLLQLQVNMLQICKLYTLFHIQRWEPCSAICIELLALYRSALQRRQLAALRLLLCLRCINVSQPRGHSSSNSL